MTALIPIANAEDVESEALHLQPVSPMDRLVSMTLATCNSPETKRVYAIRLKQFLASGHPLNREGVAMHVQSQREAGKGASTVLGSLAAIRKLAQEAQLRGLMTFEEYCNIRAIKGGRQHKTRAGMWLSLEQTQELLALPDRKTYWGKRDACILAVMIGCGFRRAEMTTLTWNHYQSRGGRMLFVDVVGKGDKRRTVPVPTWATPAVDRWQATCKEPPPAVVGRPIVSLNPSLVAGGLTCDGLYDLVETYGRCLGLDLTPHDLRRTLAQLLRSSGAPLEQIQYTLGHESISTTTIYLGSKLEMGAGAAVVDQLDLEEAIDEM